MGYVIFVGQFAGGYELEWPECGAFWSALPSAIDSSMVSGASGAIDRKKSEARSKKRHIRAILARKPR